MSSLSWQSVRISLPDFTLDSLTGTDCLFSSFASFEALLRAVGVVSGAIFISLNVFHSPHEGQRPIHFTLSCPQLSQTYAVFVFAMIKVITVLRQYCWIVFMEQIYPFCEKRVTNRLKIRTFANAMQHMSDTARSAEEKVAGRPQIAVVSLNTLAARGLASLIESVMPVADVRIFHNFIDFSSFGAEKFYHYFVTAEVLFHNPAFFTKNSRRTIVVTLGQMHSQIPRCFKTIDATLSEKDLLRAFLQMEQHAHAGGRLMQGIVHGDGRREPGADVLTPREKEVLREIVLGHINKEIADSLNISLTTVISHRRNIMEKLHARSVSALTIYAVMHGIVSADDI